MLLILSSQVARSSLRSRVADRMLFVSGEIFLKMFQKIPLFLLLSTSLHLVQGAVKLESYNVDPSSVTVSGLSAGGAMATQFHFAFSSEISGSGVFAGLPYTCAKNGIADASQCMAIPDLFAPIASLISNVEALASSSAIDPTTNIAGSKVYIFHGTADYTVRPLNGEKVKQMYERFGAVVKTNMDMNANHGFPTNFYGAACSAASGATQYINNCDYNGAFIMFDHLYGPGLTEPNTSGGLPSGDFLEFDQSDFTTGSPASISMDSIGFVYVPTRCKDRTRTCRLHVAFHGCVQSRTNAGVGDAYATKTGYIHAAEENDIIVIFPQIVATSLTNPNACFDWWGYLNSNFLTKEGAQMKAIQRMIHRVLDCPDCTTSPSSTTPVSTTSGIPGGECPINEVVFNPSPEGCQYYTICACGGSPILLQCAPGLYFDNSIKQCNVQQLVDCNIRK